MEEKLNDWIRDFPRSASMLYCKAVRDNPNLIQESLFQPMSPSFELIRQKWFELYLAFATIKHPYVDQFSLRFWRKFIGKHVDPKSLGPQFFSHWEKCLLRSPEFVLAPFLDFVLHWPHSIKKAFFSESILASLISNLKSKDEKVRKDTGLLLSAILSKLDISGEEDGDPGFWPKAIVEKYHGSSLGLEAKVDFASALLGFSHNKSLIKDYSIFDPFIVSLIAKETSEAVLVVLHRSLVSVVYRNYNSKTAGERIPPYLETLLISSLTGEKTRKSALTACFHLFLSENINPENLSPELVTQCLTVKEPVAKSVGSKKKPNNTSVAALTSLSASSLTLDYIYQQGLTLALKESAFDYESFLGFQEKFYSKMGPEESMAMVYLLRHVLTRERSFQEVSLDTWAGIYGSLFHLLLKSPIHRNFPVNLNFFTCFRCAKEFEIASIAAEKCAIAIQSVGQDESFGVTLASFKMLKLFIKSYVNDANRLLAFAPILGTFPGLKVKNMKQLVEFIAQKKDLENGGLVGKCVSGIIDNYISSSNSGLQRFGKNAIRYLIDLVSSSTVTPFIIQGYDRFAASPENLLAFSSESIDIYLYHSQSEIPVEEPFISVIERKQYVEDKNRKDYAEDKWTEDLRNEIAQKKGLKKTASYSKEERALIKSQLEKERSLTNSIAVAIGRQKIALSILASVGDSNFLVEYTPDLWPDLQELWSFKGDHEIAEAAKRLCLGLFKFGSPCIPVIILCMKLCKISVPSEYDINDITSGKDFIHDIIGKYGTKISTFEEFYVLSKILILPILDTDPGQLEIQKLGFMEMALTLIRNNLGFAPLPGYPIKALVSGLVALLKRDRRQEKLTASTLIDVCESIAGVLNEVEVGEDNDPNGEFTNVIRSLAVGLTAHLSSIRVACLNALSKFFAEDESMNAVHSDDVKGRLTALIFTLCQSEDDGVVAENLWRLGNFSLAAQNFHEKILDLVCDETCFAVHEFALFALGSGLDQLTAEDPEIVASVIESVSRRYTDHLPKQPTDIITGRFVQPNDSGKEVRRCLVKFLSFSAESLAPGLQEAQQVSNLFHFIIGRGLLDCDAGVRQLCNEAVLSLISMESVGKKHFDLLLAFFEEELAKRISDELDEYLTVYIGTIAQYISTKGVKDLQSMKADSANMVLIQRIYSLLFQTLTVPSEPVQVAVAKCLATLVRDHRWSFQQVNVIVKAFKSVLERDSSSEGWKRGAAFGITALVKGRGVRAIKELNLIDSMLMQWFQASGKGSSLESITSLSSEDISIIRGICGEGEGRIGLFQNLQQESLAKPKPVVLKLSALYLTESFIVLLPNLFEPYVTSVMPHLLATLNEANTRETSLYCSQILMRSLSQAGLTLTIPSLVKILDDNRAAWRAKKAAVQMISQLSKIDRPALLGKITRALLPRLVQVVLEEPVADVKNEAKSALASFANGIVSSVSGGEIEKTNANNMNISILSKIVNAVIDTLSSAANNKMTLATLNLVNDSCIDMEENLLLFQSNSLLALLFPIFRRALAVDARSELKQLALQVICNLVQVNGQNEFFMSQLRSNLKSVLVELLVDPVPETRSLAARCFGIITEVYGEDAFSSDLLRSFMARLDEENTVVGRNGISQVICEIVAGISSHDDVGNEGSRLISIMNEIYAKTQQPKATNNSSNSSSGPISSISKLAHIRENFFCLYLYLPLTLGLKQMEPFLPKLIQLYFETISEESMESIRELAIQSIMTLVRNFLGYFVEHNILNRWVFKGVLDEKSRMRLAMGRVIQELVVSVSRGIHEEAEDNHYSSDTSLKDALITKIGEENYRSVLACAVFLRNDRFSVETRTVASNVWKMLVTVPLKVMKEIMWKVFRILIGVFGEHGAGKGTIKTIVESSSNGETSMIRGFEGNVDNVDGNDDDDEDDDDGEDEDTNDVLEIARTSLSEFIVKIGIHNVMEILMPQLLSNFKTLNLLNQNGSCNLLHLILTIYYGNSGSHGGNGNLGILYDFEEEFKQFCRLSISLSCRPAALVIKDLIRCGMSMLDYLLPEFYDILTDESKEPEERSKAKLSISELANNVSAGQCWTWLSNRMMLGSGQISQVNLDLLELVIPAISSVDLVKAIRELVLVCMRGADCGDDPFRKILCQKIISDSMVNLEACNEELVVSLHRQVLAVLSEHKGSIVCWFISDLFSAIKCGNYSKTQAEELWDLEDVLTAYYQVVLEIYLEFLVSGGKAKVTLISSSLPAMQNIVKTAGNDFMAHLIEPTEKCFHSLAKQSKSQKSEKTVSLDPSLPPVKTFASPLITIFIQSILSNSMRSQALRLLNQCLTVEFVFTDEMIAPVATQIIGCLIRVTSSMYNNDQIITENIFDGTNTFNRNYAQDLDDEDEDSHNDNNENDNDSHDDNNDDNDNIQYCYDGKTVTDLLEGNSWVQLLLSLQTLIQRIPTSAKPFCPQLQRILFKLLGHLVDIEAESRETEILFAYITARTCDVLVLVYQLFPAAANRRQAVLQEAMDSLSAKADQINAVKVYLPLFHRFMARNGEETRTFILSGLEKLQQQLRSEEDIKYGLLGLLSDDLSGDERGSSLNLLLTQSASPQDCCMEDRDRPLTFLLIFTTAIYKAFEKGDSNFASHFVSNAAALIDKKVFDKKVFNKKVLESNVKDLKRLKGDWVKFLESRPFKHDFLDEIPESAIYWIYCLTLKL